MTTRFLRFVPSLMKKFELNITLFYLVFGFLWIFFSDRVLDVLIPDRDLLVHFQTFKGVFYILITSFFLYYLVKNHVREMQLSEMQRDESEFRFAKLYEDGPFGMVMAQKDFRIKSANP